MAENEFVESVNVEEPVIENNDVPVSNADLDAAFQEFIGIEEEIEEPENPEVPPVQQPPENPSRLGRKVARLEEKMVTKDDLVALNSKIDSFFEHFTAKEPPQQKVDEFGEPIDEPVDIDKRVEEVLSRREKAEKEEHERVEKAYANNYVGQLKELLGEVEDLEVAKEVYRKMITPGSKWNVRYSDNPFADVAKNFAKAVKDTKVKKAFDGRAPDVPIGINNANSNTVTSIKSPKLDPIAEEYAKMTGMSVDDINEALEGEVPANLARRY